MLRRDRMTRQSIGFVGNCQAELLQKAFQKAAPPQAFTSFYHFFDVAHDLHDAARAEVTNCDVLLMQDIADIEDYPLRRAIPSGTEIVQFPFLRFASPWPYDDFNGVRDNAARNQDDPAVHTTTYYDGALGRLRRLVPEPGARLAAYRADKIEGMPDPARLHDFEARRLAALDERFGMGIGRFILDGFRSTQLFYTVNRPGGAVLAMLLGYIFKTLDLDLAAAPDDILDELRAIQVPVHPAVARRLSIAWATETRLYRNGDREVDWESHVRAYIERYG